jgi:hypothetical protein
LNNNALAIAEKDLKDQDNSKSFSNHGNDAGHANATPPLWPTPEANTPLTPSQPSLGASIQTAQFVHLNIQDIRKQGKDQQAKKGGAARPPTENQTLSHRKQRQATTGQGMAMLGIKEGQPSMESSVPQDIPNHIATFFHMDAARRWKDQQQLQHTTGTEGLDLYFRTGSIPNVGTEPNRAKEIYIQIEQMRGSAPAPTAL